jgi:[ribosomal protein S5]-alanine N-acetyltransferase
MTGDIHTPRLTLRLMGRPVIDACIAGDLVGAGEMLGVTISDELLDHPSSLRYTLKQLTADPLYLPWGARAIVLGETMIGLIRFHSRPGPEYLRQYAPDGVELGYRIFAPYRRQGFVFEAVNALIGWAQSEFDVRYFVASIAPDNIPSLQLAARLGFKKVGETIDETDGPEFIYLLNKC